MTNEEAIKAIKSHCYFANLVPVGKEALDMAIKALEQQPCEDCVSKKDIYFKLTNGAYPNETIEQFTDRLVKELNTLPPVQPKIKWIPVSESLPNDRDWYLGIFKEPDTGWINPLPFICDYVGSETKATTKEHWILRGFTDRDERIDYYFNLECVAWMPLPKAYEPHESEKQK